MDQMKIGKFIAEERKRNKLTQQQLADILGISNKTISKWECGNGFPEISLLLPLCEKLDISVNELLSGERLSKADYQKKAEENIVNMITEKEENKKKMQLSALTGIISSVAFITLILIVCIYTDVMALPVKITIVIISCAIFGIGLYVAMQSERTIGYYQCRHCGKTFIPDFGAYVMGMHLLTTRHLKCPHCTRKSWCKKLMSKED